MIRIIDPVLTDYYLEVKYKEFHVLRRDDESKVILKAKSLAEAISYVMEKRILDESADMTIAEFNAFIQKLNDEMTSVFPKQEMSQAQIDKMLAEAESNGAKSPIKPVKA